MAVVEEILRSEADGSISFGNHKLAKKAKVEDYEHAGDLLKVKTYNEMTKLEKNGMFLYESVPGTSVLEFKESDNLCTVFSLLFALDDKLPHHIHLCIRRNFPVV